MNVKSMFIGMVITLFTAMVIAQVYKWIDEEGRTHYSDMPVSDKDAQEINLPDAPILDDADADRRNRMLQYSREITERKLETQRKENIEVSVRKKSILARREHCSEARRELAVIQYGYPIYRDQSGQLQLQWKFDTYKGKREYISDENRSTELARVKQRIATNCAKANDDQAQATARRELKRSEHCQAARADLAALENPQSHASRHALKSMQANVKKLCDD